MADSNQKDFSIGTDYHSKNVDDKILLHLRDLGQKLHFLYDGKDSQRRALITLRNSGEVSQRELTEKLSIKPGSMSEIVAKLANKGFIERTPSVNDKRTMIITLTELGQKRAEEVLQFRTERRTELFAGLEESEKNSLLFLLEKINTDKINPV